MTIDSNKKPPKTMGRPKKSEEEKMVSARFTFPSKVKEQLWEFVGNGDRSRFVVKAVLEKLKREKRK